MRALRRYSAKEARGMTPEHKEAGEIARRWIGATPQEQGIYDHYMTGSERGDLHRFVRAGKLDVGKPDRSDGHRYAAWMAGRDLANQPEDQSQ